MQVALKIEWLNREWKRHIPILTIGKERIEERRKRMARLLQRQRGMKSKLLKTSLLLTLLLSMLGLSACHTVDGAGKDIEKAGQGIQNSAEKHS